MIDNVDLVERELDADDLACEIELALKALISLSRQADGARARRLRGRVSFWCVDLRRALDRLEARHGTTRTGKTWRIAD